MKALVSISQTSQGEHVQLLGWGEDEHDARVAAYEYVNHGRNDFDEEHKGGTLLDVAQRLTDLNKRAKRWHDVFTEDGVAVGTECSSAHIELLNALQRLYIYNSKLDYKNA